MGKREIKKIDEFADVITGGTPSTLISDYWDNGTVPWLQSGVCQNKDITECSTYITESGLHKSSAQVMPKDSVLIALTGATTGKVGYLTFNACANQSVTGILPNNNFIPRYLFYYLISIRKKTLAESYGGAQKHISQGYVKKIPVPLPPLAEQKRIADVLDTASGLIKKRKEQIRLIDQLAKSLFIEMFGDPVENQMGWDTWKLEEITDKIGSGATPRGGKESYISTGIALVRSMNVYNGSFKYDDLAHITEIQAKHLDIVTIKENDVLINITGASVARSCIIPRDILPARVNQHVSIIRCKPDIVTSKYLNQVLINTSYQNFLLDISNSGGATREAITKQQLECLPIPLPPLSLQNEFADRITVIEQQKALLQDGLAKMETAYKALMQEYFG